MEKLVLLVFYVLNIAIYLMIYYLFTGKWLRRKWIYWIGGMAVAGIAFIGAGWSESLIRLLIGCVVFLCTFAAMQERIAQRVPLFVTLLFFDSCVRGFWSALIQYLCHWGVFEMPTHRHMTAFLEIFLEAVSILTICFLKRRRERFERQKRIAVKKNIQYLILSISLLVVVAISTLEYCQEAINVSWFYNTIAGLVLGAYFGLLLMIFFIIYIRNMNERLEQEVETEKNYMALQEKYYENLLRQETETRRFRHDFRNHLICLGQLAEQEDSVKVQDYIHNLQGALEATSRKFCVSGNRIIDILTDHYGKLLGKQAKIEASGQLSEELSVKDMQLCTIYGNLIANAVEAQTTLAEEDRLLRLRFQEGQEYVRITIVNRMIEDIDFEPSGRIRSKKKESKDHGFGLQNVERVLRETNGKLECSVQDGCFCATVTWKK